MRVAMILAVVGLTACASSGNGGGGAAAPETIDGTGDVATGECGPGDLGGDCNPLCEDSGCDEGQHCTLTEQGLGCVPDGTQAIGDACNESNPCVSGACVASDDIGNFECREFCAGDGDCAADFQCNPLSDTEPPLSACTPRPEGCSVFEQDCEDPAQACTLNGCMAPGTAAVGDDCGQDAPCAAGLVCARDAADNERCHEPCNPSTGGPNPKCHLKCSSNFAELQNADGTSTGVGVCQLPDEEEDCNLMTHDCEAGQACYTTPNGPRCRAEGNAVVGEACQGDNDCVKGAVCWPPGGTKSCKALCDPNEPTHSECEVSTSQCPQITTNAGYCDE